MFRYFSVAAILRHPVSFSARVAAVATVPIAIGALAVSGWSTAAAIAASLAFFVFAFVILYLGARASIRRLNGAPSGGTLWSSDAFALERNDATEGWVFTGLATLAAVGAVLQVPAIVASIAAGAFDEVPHQISWIACCAVVWMLLCAIRARRLARELRGWFASETPGALRGVERVDGRWVPATLTFEDEDRVILQSQAGREVIPHTGTPCRPGPGWRFGRQSIVMAAEDRDVVFSPIGSSDPARWLHYALGPEWFRDAPSPMWELIAQLNGRTAERG